MPNAAARTLNRNKQIVAAVGSIISIVATSYASGAYDIPEIVGSVIALLTILGVGEIRNKPKD
jgi:phosphate/sulfate permease